MTRKKFREVLDCGSPLPLFHRGLAARKRQRAAALQDAGALTCLLALITGLLLPGCATSPGTQIRRPSNSFPTDALITQRGVLTVLGRQFTLNGYLALSERGGKRLIVTENFGGVLADVIVKPDGSVRVIRSSSAFKPEWIRRHIAADVECIFGNAPRSNCPGQRLSPTHFVIERRCYKLDLQIIETKPGPQPAEMFEPTEVTPQ